jgi:hypothetical protein
VVFVVFVLYVSDCAVGACVRMHVMVSQSVCVCVRRVRDEKKERARERETARQTERESQPRDRDRQTDSTEREPSERGRAAIEGQTADRQAAVLEDG